MPGERRPTAQSSLTASEFSARLVVRAVPKQPLRTCHERPGPRTRLPLPSPCPVVSPPSLSPALCQLGLCAHPFLAYADIRICICVDMYACQMCTSPHFCFSRQPSPLAFSVSFLSSPSVPKAAGLLRVLPAIEALRSFRSRTLERIVEAAEKKNIVLVVAAGNHQCDLGDIEKTPCLAENGAPKGFPAAYSDRFFNLISVGAVEMNGRAASFTNFDGSPTHGRVQVMAPGRDLPSCNDQKQSLDGKRNAPDRNERAPIPLFYLSPSPPLCPV